MRLKVESDRQCVEAIYEAFGQMVTFASNKSSDRIINIKIENDFDDALRYDILITIRIESFYLPDGMDDILMMRCLRCVKVVIQS